ncbi:hypothetical protein AM609_14105 [Actinomyces sp. oral taxon 414]|uniref:FHA domain-containing protein FhaB/FipA n=1 Tax=Actinomyces sp. oral taxon 414 TaxID=712122 RepID=UPI0006B05441|nr:FHA domain-containing protein [Actinomyces sp. oral taxon 414]ALD00281.1 hypothetical protein AM609_14105 [Actinomyces sp. oral taxon 414]
MSELAFTLARIGFLVLLWVFVLLTLRALRRDVADMATPGAQRRPARTSAPGPARAQSHRRGASRLIITEGPLAGSTVPLSPTSISIGRSPSCTLVLEDSYASSRHARIFPKDGTWWLEDLGSTNGTTLAGHPVHGTVELSMGVPVRIGQTTLELRP